MIDRVTAILKRGRYGVIGTVLALTLVVAGLATIGSPSRSDAANCDPVNIIQCGLAGSSTAENINSFKFIYNRGSDSGHSDIKAVYAWAGATNTKVTNMNTTNTKMGTLYRDGTIKVNGKVVGTDAWISARFTEGSGFTQISPGVWARKTTTSFVQPSEPVLVHFNQNGVVDFAVAINCGNAVKVTPPPTPPTPQPKAELACVSLTKELMGPDQSLAYRLTAQANAKNTAITRYEFHFGDGSANVETVETDSETATITHTYAHYNTDYNAHVVVFSKDFANGKTSADCALTVHTNKKPKVESPSIACTSLQSTNVGLDYKFTAVAQVQNTSVSAFVFYISDGTTTRLPTTQTSATLEHHFAAYDTLYTVYATVTDGQTMTPQTTMCTLQIKTPQPDECKPGIPVGSPECTFVTPTPPITPTPTVETASTTLAKTGPADVVAIFIGATTGATLLYHYILQRKYNS